MYFWLVNFVIMTFGILRETVFQSSKKQHLPTILGDSDKLRTSVDQYPKFVRFPRFSVGEFFEGNTSPKINI